MSKVKTTPSIFKSKPPHHGLTPVTFWCGGKSTGFIGITLAFTAFTVLTASTLVLPLVTPPASNQAVNYENVTPGRYMICSTATPTSTPPITSTPVPSATQMPTPPVNLTATATPMPTQTPFPTWSPTPPATPTPTGSIVAPCVVSGTTINKGEGTCDEKTNTVSVCEGNNQMVQKQDYCGSGQVCRSQAGSFQIRCEAACQLKMGSGAQSKADLVILPEDYDSYNDFLSSVDKAISALNNTNLGAARLGKINVWALLDLSQTYFQGFNCPSVKGAVVACWDHTKAMSQAMSRCGGDTYSIFNNDTHRVDSVGGIAIWGGNYIYRFALDYPTFPHELGHSMAGLVDEYSFGIAAPPGTPAGVNCSDTGSQSQTIPCPKWAGRFTNVGCYPRCGYTNFYRPILKSIMDRGGANAVSDFNEPSLVDGWDEILKLFP